MAKRPVFIPETNGRTLVRTEYVDFQWHSGLAISQKQNSIASLHSEARAQLTVDHILEVSSKGVDKLGVALSAFNLQISDRRIDRSVSVECAFQGSKVFEDGGPFIDLLDVAPRDAKRNPRLQESGNLKGFRFLGREWALEPQTAFYDWLYLNALKARPELADQVSRFSGFTDIEFNPERSINCQAYSVALFVSLRKSNRLNEVTQSEKVFLDFLTTTTINNAHENRTAQGSLF